MQPAARLSDSERLQACYDYIDTVNDNVEHFLADKSKVLHMELESIEEDFRTFWDYIKAEGDYKEALASFNTPHNSSAKRKLNYSYRLPLLAKREWQHLKMYFKS